MDEQETNHDTIRRSGAHKETVRKGPTQEPTPLSEAPHSSIQTQDLAMLEGEGSLQESGWHASGDGPDDDVGVYSADSLWPVRVYIDHSGHLAAQRFGRHFDINQLPEAKTCVEETSQSSSTHNEVYIIVGLGLTDEYCPPADSTGQISNRLSKSGQWVSNTNNAIDMTAWNTVIFEE